MIEYKNLNSKVPSRIIRLLDLACLLGIILGFTSCISKPNISGIYRSNFPTLGFFVTEIRLKSDSSFEYFFHGDMISDTATGHYKVNRRKLILAYNPVPIDTSGFKYCRDLGLKLDVNDLKSDENLPHVFYIRQNKLYSSYRENRIVRKAFGYSKRPKYFIFGTHFYKHKYFLKRID